MICSNCNTRELAFIAAKVRTQIGSLTIEDGSNPHVPVCPECGHQDLTSAEWAACELRAASWVMEGDLRNVDGEVLRDVRKILGLRQTDLARLLNRDAATLSRYETGKEVIPVEIKLAVGGLVDRVLKHGPDALDLERAHESDEFRLTG